MDERSQIKIAEDPSDLEGTPLGRRPFMNLLKAGGALALGSSLAGCSGGGGGSGTGSQGNTSQGTGNQGSQQAPEELVIAQSSDADVLDPHLTVLSSSSRVMSLLYDGMIRMDGEQNFHEMLGKGFEVSDDGTEWVIECNVNSGITFHNGKDFTVDDVVFTFKRLLEKSLVSSFTVGSLNGVEKVDNKRVKFTFDDPYAYFNNHAAMTSYFGVIPENLGGKSEEEFGQAPIGTGPYQFEKWVKGQKIVLTRNDNWQTPTYDVVKSEDPPAPRRIVWQVIPSTTPRIQGLLTGDVDAIVLVPPRKRQQIKQSEKAKVHTVPGTSLYYLAPHNGLPPTDNENVRKAIAHSIDRKRIVEDIYKGVGQVNYAPMPAAHPPWAGPKVKKEVGYKYNPQKAKGYLNEAGWSKDNSGNYTKNGETLQLSMVTPNAPATRLQTSEEIVAMLGEVGISVNLTTSTPNTAITTMLKGNTNLTNSAIGWNNASIVQGMLSSEAIGATNLQFFKDEKTDQYLTKAARTLDDKKRADIYQKMQLRVMRLCGTVPIMSPTQNTAVKSDLTGYHYLSGAEGNLWIDMRLESE